MVTQDRNNSACPDDEIATILASHVSFRQAIEPDVPLDQIRAQAEAEMVNILRCFPGNKTLDTTVVMSAWLCILCLVDDEVDKMAVAPGQTLLKELALYAQNAELETQLVNPICVNGEHERVRWAFSCFCRHATLHLPATQYKALCRDISIVFWGMIDEIIFKSERSTNLDEYLSIRRCTIGVNPFFGLLRGDRGYPNMYSLVLSSIELRTLTIVVLHNDLIGLEREVASGEWMNYAIVSATSPSEHVQNQLTKRIKLGITLTAERCNQSTKTLMQDWKAITEKDPGWEQDYALALLVFVAKHFHAAKASSRYKQISSSVSRY